MSEPWACIGHSHVTALDLAQDPDLDVINFWATPNLWAEGQEGVRFRDELAQRLGRARLVISLIGGNAHTILGVVEHHRPFDFVLPSQPSLPVDEARTLLPAEAVRTKLEELAFPLLDWLTAVISAATGPIVHVAPPPPLADDGLITVPWDLYPGQPHQVAPKWVRYKTWKMACEVTEAYCDRRGIRFLAAPDGAKDDEGFLHPDFRKDAAHANGAYGALVLQALGRTL